MPLRYLKHQEIENILDFIQPNQHIPKDTANSIVESHKNKLRNQLRKQQVNPLIIPELKQQIMNNYYNSLIEPGESVGIVCAQSIGQKNTQCTLNSVDWSEQILYTKNNMTKIEPIGQMIDKMLEENIDLVEYIKENRTEYLNIPEGYKIPSCDANGNTNWFKIEAITRHLPVGDLVKVITESGRTVIATQSKSFLVWNGSIFEDVNGCDIKVGDILPTTLKLNIPFINYFLDLKTILTKNDTCLDNLPLDNDFGFFVGFYLATGWITKTFLCIRNNNPIIQQRIFEYCKRYGIDKIKNVSRGTSSYFEINSVFLVILFKTICDSGLEKNKRIPEFAYTAPKQFIQGLIDGYYSGNGFFQKDGNISVSSVSQKLILGISFLLTYFGVFGKISNIKRIYNLYISNEYKQQFDYCFTDLLEYKYEKIFPKNRDVYFDAVVSVEYIKATKEYVYDLTIENTRNFQLYNGLNVRDTFHRAGLSEATMTTGVPRFQELLNSTKNPKIINHKIYFNKGNSSIQELRETIGSSIVSLTLEDIILSVNIEINKKEESWYKCFKILYSDEFSNYENCLSFKLNISKLYEYKLTMKEIADVIEEEYSDLHCVFSPGSEGQLDVFVDTSEISFPDDKKLFINNENCVNIYMEQVILPILEEKNICGISGIKEIFLIKEKNEWIVETNSVINKSSNKLYNNYLKLLSHPNVDYTKTISNNVWDIYEIFDIEAARQFLIEEFMSIMDGINICHAMLLVDRMTYNGTISSITRYTLKKDEAGPFSKASFEESLENFTTAAAEGDKEPTEGVSASIICGKRISVGTGMMSVSVDIEQLPTSKSILYDVQEYDTEY